MIHRLELLVFYVPVAYHVCHVFHDDLFLQTKVFPLLRLRPQILFHLRQIALEVDVVYLLFYAIFLLS